MSINSALVKLADKIDVDGKSTISPEYKNPNNSIEKSIERIAENYNGSGGGGGGVLIVNDVNGTLDKTWKEIHDNPSAVIKADVGSQTTVFHIGIIGEGEGSYGLVAFSYDMHNAVSEVYVTNSIDGYPVKSS